MLKSVIVLVLVCVVSAVLSEASVSVPFSSCGSGIVTVNKVIADSWPPTAGSTEHVYIDVTNSELITNGTYSINVEFDGISINSQSGNLNDLNVSLPVLPGPVSFEKTINVPSFLPLGKIDITVKAVDEKGNQLACVEMSTWVPLDNNQQPPVEGGHHHGRRHHRGGHGGRRDTNEQPRRRHRKPRTVVQH
jgi:hypothetical protein